jgi:hypothetical protein
MISLPVRVTSAKNARAIRCGCSGRKQVVTGRKRPIVRFIMRHPLGGLPLQRVCRLFRKWKHGNYNRRASAAGGEIPPSDPASDDICSNLLILIPAGHAADRVFMHQSARKPNRRLLLRKPGTA